MNDLYLRWGITFDDDTPFIIDFVTTEPPYRRSVLARFPISAAEELLKTLPGMIATYHENMAAEGPVWGTEFHTATFPGLGTENV